jgi:hypothetical protein
VQPVAYRNNTNDAATGGVTFTNYDLVWAGEDKVLGTADDRIIRDGEFVAPHVRRMSAANASATPHAARTDASARQGSK